MARIQKAAVRAPTIGAPAGSPGTVQRKSAANVEGTYVRVRAKARIQLKPLDGCVFVTSDAHYYGEPSTAHRASIELAKRLRPWGVINNGDAIDGASISRWPVGSFTELAARPTVVEEIRLAAARLADYEQLDFLRYQIWNLGNHDARFETKLAEHVPQFIGVPGFTLKEHFPFWLPAWRTDILDADGSPQVIIKHRYKGGMHAGQNNVLWSGANFVTGHDHMLKSYAVTTTKGLFWGVHAGTMAPIDSPLFVNYTEDNPVNWQEGFAILHFAGGRYLGPELVHCTPDGRAIFRGEILKI